ncbi:hypothetical protein [Puia dinghuensis]|uniref:Uncharacterized protein n=1 Tax=Puia dinghuensis TaxID=1792502 RepID=A0A8J2XW03_9BACT|nr:hypothetical protein [Puia dinghuensis]GGB19964.1 hypothetical protein GCM10011511_49680 [Puia dinghuensis]
MQLDKSILKEEAHIGEELMADSNVSQLERKCFVVRQAVADGDFTLEEALAAYGVAREDFNNYLSQQVVSEINVFFSHSSSHVLAVTASIAVIGELYKVFLGNVDPQAQTFQDHLRSLSQAVSSGKVAV